LRHPVATGEIDGDHRLKLVWRFAGGWDCGTDTSVVDKHIDSTKNAHRLSNKGCALGRIRYVCLKDRSATTSLLHHSSSVLEFVNPAGTHSHVGAGLGSCDSEGDAQACGRTGNNHGSTIESETIQHAHCG